MGKEKIIRIALTPIILIVGFVFAFLALLFGVITELLELFNDIMRWVIGDDLSES